MVGKSSDEKLALKVSKLKAELKNLRERLRKSEEKYKDIIENIEDGCGECDLAGNFTFTNTVLRNILGYSKDELLGMNYRKYMDEGMAEKVYQKFNKAYRTGMPDKGFDYEIIRKDGTKRVIEVSVSLKRDSEGRRIGFRSILRDVTDRRRIEHEREKYRSNLEAIFSSVKDAIITVDPDMRVIEASFSRPSVSNDNPYSESLFRTMKYRPEYPSKPFKYIDQAQSWVEGFAFWYP